VGKKKKPDKGRPQKIQIKRGDCRRRKGSTKKDYCFRGAKGKGRGSWVKELKKPERPRGAAGVDEGGAGGTLCYPRTTRRVARKKSYPIQTEDLYRCEPIARLWVLPL